MHQRNARVRSWTCKQRRPCCGQAMLTRRLRRISFKVRCGWGYAARRSRVQQVALQQGGRAGNGQGGRSTSAGSLHQRCSCGGGPRAAAAAAAAVQQGRPAPHREQAEDHVVAMHALLHALHECWVALPLRLVTAQQALAVLQGGEERGGARWMGARNARRGEQRGGGGGGGAPHEACVWCHGPSQRPAQSAG